MPHDNVAKRLKRLKDENRRLKQMVADLSLDDQALKVCPGKRVVSPSGRRVVAEHFQEDFELSERRAADLAQVGRSTLRYRSRRAADNDVRDRLRALATERPRFGYRRQRVLI